MMLGRPSFPIEAPVTFQGQVGIRTNMQELKLSGPKMQKNQHLKPATASSSEVKAR